MRIALDIETTNLNPWKDELVAVGLGYEDDGRVQIYLPHDDDSKASLAELLDELFLHNEIIVHNAAFDLVWLAVKLGVIIPRNVWDTMVAETMLTAGLQASVSLEEVMLRRFNMSLDKTEQTTFTLDTSLTDAQREYLENDVKYLFNIRDQQQYNIEREYLEDIWEIEAGVTPVFCKMIHRGIKVNRQGIVELIEAEKQKVQNILQDITRTLNPIVMHERIRKYDEQREKLNLWEVCRDNREQELRNEWDNHMEEDARGRVGSCSGWLDEWKDTSKRGSNGRWAGENRYVQHHMKTWREYNKRPPKPKLDKSDVNLASSQQVVACFRELGWELDTSRTPAMKAFLPNLTKPDDRRIMQSILDFRKSEKLVTAFGEPIIEKIDDRDYVHAHFRQYGTATGRPTCSDPNLLQMPANPAYRGQFICEEDEVLIIADYSQMELRLTAQQSGDPRMIEAYLQDLDLHAYTASLMYEVKLENVTKEQRDIAKTCNFGILYGSGPKTLRSVLATGGVFLTESQAKDAIERWKEAYQVAASAIERWGYEAQRKGYAVTAMGRKRYFDTKGLNQWEMGRVRRQGANHMIQGSNADVTKLAMVLADEQLFMYDSQVVLQVYDEIVAVAPKCWEKEAAQVVYAAMKAAAEEVLIDVPAAVDCFVSPTWNEKDAIMRVGE